jgi:hypothetical protein
MTGPRVFGKPGVNTTAEWRARSALPDRGALLADECVRGEADRTVCQDAAVELQSSRRILEGEFFGADGRGSAPSAVIQGCRISAGKPARAGDD